MTVALARRVVDDITLDLSGMVSSPEGYEVVEHSTQGILRVAPEYLTYCVDAALVVGKTDFYFGIPDTNIPFVHANACFIDECLRQQSLLPDRLQMIQGAFPYYICMGTKYKKVGDMDSERLHVGCLLHVNGSWRRDFVPLDEVGAEKNDFVVMVPARS